MTGRARAAIRRHWRIPASIAVAGVAYCSVIEAFLPRQDSLPPAASPEFVVALSAGVRRDGELSRTGRRRLERAIQIAHATGATLITTRVKNSDGIDLTSDRPQHRLIDSAGLVDRWRVLDGFAVNTRDEAMRLRPVTRSSTIVVVTSRLHTRRACLTFERLGYRVTCVSSGLDGPWWRIPYAVAYESAAWVKYRSKRWIIPNGKLLGSSKG